MNKERGNDDDAAPSMDDILALYREAENVSQTGTWLWNATDDTAFWSDELYRVLGLPKHSTRPSLAAFATLLSAEDSARIDAATSSVTANGGPISLDVTIVPPDGLSRVIRIWARRLSESGALPVRIAGVMRDVSESVKEEQKQARLIQQMSHAQRIARIASSVLHLNSGKVEWSEQMYTLTGIDPAQQGRRPGDFFEMVHPDDREALTEAIKDNLRGIPHPVECRFTTRQGELRYAHIESELAYEASEPLLHGTLLDITERKRLEAQLLQAQKMDALGKLAGGVAHDLNNYLQIISGNVDILSPQIAVDALGAQCVADIEASLRLCAALTGGLLAFSRQQPIRPQLLDLHEVVRTSLQLVKKLLGPSLEIHLALQAQEPHVVCDLHQLQQVLLNLLLNARDATDGQGNLHINTTNPRPGWISLEIIDDGCGMSDEVLAQVFEPFFTTKPEGHGTGLGLSTSFGIIEQAGGKIQASSKLGVGSTLTVSLPNGSETDVTLATVGGGPAQPFASKAKVLLVDDEPMVRRLTALFLQHAGYEVTQAENGKVALELFIERSGGFDLLVSDVVMPELNGAELVREVRALAADFPCLLISGYAERKLLESGPAASCPLLSKPFSKETLLSAVSRLLTEQNQ